MLSILMVGFGHVLFLVCLFGQMLFFLTALIGKISKTKNKVIHLVFYYVMTITAQLVGAYKEATGKSKPVWEKAESTR